MPRGTTKERAQAIAADFIAGGMKYAPIGRKWADVGIRGGTDQSLATVLGRQKILKNAKVQKALNEMMPGEGLETRQYVRKKLYEHAENKTNPHISLKSVEILAKTEAMLTENVNMKGQHTMADFIVDLRDYPNKDVSSSTG